MSRLLPIKRQASSLASQFHGRTFSTSRSVQATYGFVGLGRMGLPMARNLRSKLPSSDKLVVYDVNTEATQSIAKEMQGVEVADNETIITVLPEPSHVQNVYYLMLKSPKLQKEGSTDRLFVDCSTIDPSTSGQVANAIHSSGQGKFIDAPMSGGVVGAAAGKLTFMIGSSEELVDRATKLLLTMGKRVVHLGPQTSGLKGKLANNYLLALNNIATAEAMNMGVKWGLDPATFADMVNTSTGKCWPSEINNPVPGVIKDAPASRGYEGGFYTALMNKDLKLAMQAAEDSGIEPRLGPLARDIYTQVDKDESLKGKDFSVVYKYLGGK
ncbi:hypothetical protein MBLNU459_g1858t2 [Dothideomycetes sp. NU459]